MLAKPRVVCYRFLAIQEINHSIVNARGRHPSVAVDDLHLKLLHVCCATISDVASHQNLEVWLIQVMLDNQATEQRFVDVGLDVCVIDSSRLQHAPIHYVGLEIDARDVPWKANIRPPPKRIMPNACVEGWIAIPRIADFERLVFSQGLSSGELRFRPMQFSRLVAVSMRAAKQSYRHLFFGT
jgi:hypothetical protein